MRRLISIPPLLFQFIITFLTLFLIFILFFMTKGNENVGIIEGIGFESHKAIYAVIIIAFTMVITFLIGLPIRIIPNLYQWWTPNPIINILALLVGLSLMFFYSKSFFNGESVSGPSGVSSTLIVGDPYQVLTGWFLLTFSLLHLYPVSFSKLAQSKTISSDK